MSNHAQTTHSPAWTQRLRRLLSWTPRPDQLDQRAQTWAREVKSVTDLPQVYQHYFLDLGMAPGSSFPYTVLTPTFKGGYGRPEMERLLCIADGHVHLLESVGAELHAARFSPSDVTYLERGSILLHAWITIASVNGGPVTIRFNSVTEHLMTSFIDCLRPPAAAESGADLQTEYKRFAFLAATHFKFMSYGQACLRPGARVAALILQPRIRRDLFTFGSFSLSRLVSPAHLTLLTDSELILIRDDASQRWLKGSPHGAIWTYIDRGKLLSCSLSPVDKEDQLLTLGLPGGVRIERRFDSGKSEELEHLLHELNLRTGVVASTE